MLIRLGDNMAVWCSIRTFAKHAQELGNNQPAEPIFFVKPNNCIVRSGPIHVSSHPGSVHHEVECVIRLGNDLQPEAIAVGLDLTDRATQSQLRSEQLPWTKGKCFKGSAYVGQFSDYEGEFDELCSGKYSVIITVNDEVRQSANLAEMSISPANQMTNLLTWAPVMAGDYLFTGTPSGVGELQVGDKVSAILQTSDGEIISQINAVCH